VAEGLFQSSGFNSLPKAPPPIGKNKFKGIKFIMLYKKHYSEEIFIYLFSF
jgi:hypothetical protein